MENTEKILQLLHTFEDVGLIEQSPQKTYALFTDQMIGVGMGEQGIAFSRADVLGIMAAGAREKADTASYQLSYGSETVMMTSPITANACAKVRVTKTQDGVESYSSFAQLISVVLTDGQWKICAVSATPDVLSAESIAAYPLAFADQTLARLRAQLRDEAMELLNQSFSGGVLGFYVDVPHRFPLYFANDSIISLTGYTRQEFQEKFGDDVIALAAKQDRAELAVRIRARRKEAPDDQTKVRLERKDGKIIWVLDRIRMAADNEGRPVQLAAVTDITEMVQMQNAVEEKNLLLQAQADELYAQNEQLNGQQDILAAQNEQLAAQQEEMSAQNEQLIAQQDTLSQQAQALAVSEERFRIALEKTSHVIFDYDMDHHIMRLSIHGRPDKVVHITKDDLSTLPGGTVVASDQGVLRDAFEALRGGANQSSCIIRLVGEAGEQLWNRLSMTAIRDQFDGTVRVIGMVEDITKEKQAELAYAREEQYRQAILGSAMASYVINFTKNQIESCQLQDTRCLWTEAGEPYEYLITHAAKSWMSIEHYTRFLHAFSTANILSCFASAQNEIRLDYLATDFGGAPRWLQNTMRLVVDASTGDKKGYLYVTDIDDEKHEEMVLIRKAEQDALTGLLNNGAVRLHVSQRLEAPDFLQTGVFMMLDIDHFKSINDTYGHPFGDEVLVGAAKALANSFRDTDIVGRLGGDEFCVFFCGIRTKERIADAAQTICEHIHKLRAPDKSLGGFTCSLGIAMCDGKKRTFADLYREADAALYQVKDAGRDGYAFYGTDGRVPANAKKAQG